MSLPNDPFMLLSTINMKLRDFYQSLDALCEDYDISITELQDKLASIAYYYDASTNQFK